METQDNIRETMRQLPDWMQPSLTTLTGKPYAGETPRYRTATFHVVTAIATLVAGVALSLLGCLFGPVYLMLLGWLATVSGARKLQVCIMHYCAHQAVFCSQWANSWLGSAISVVLTIPSFTGYCRGHISDHHSARLMTSADPTFRFLVDRVGLRPGASKTENWRRLCRTLFSPVFHARFVVDRLWGQVQGASIPERIGSALFLGGLLLIVGLNDSWKAFCLAWVIPMVIGYQISAALRLCAEHLWRIPSEPEQGRAAVAQLTQAVFLGEAAPDRDLPLRRRVIAWIRWTLRMLWIHLPGRLFVLVGETPAHDFHHRHLNSLQWPYAAFARQQDIDSGHPGWPPYHEAWGLASAIDATFKSMSRARV